MGQAFAQYVRPDERAKLAEQLQSTHRHAIDAFTIELTATKANGQPVHVALHGSHFSEVKSSSPCLILQAQDITAQRQAQQQLHHIAFHDGLTGLPNRRRFNQQLGELAEGNGAAVDRRFALMFIDCDRFKVINDSMGHSAGDEFLVAVGRRLKELLRSQDLVARVGGDEFAVLVRDAQSDDKVRQLGTRILEALRQPVQVGSVKVTSSVSMGIALSRPDHTAPEDLLRDADLAMYAAKAQGKDRLVFFDATMLAENAHRLSLEVDLRNAINQGDIEVAYQPLFKLRSGALTGFEALCRWNHPKLGTIAPATFIPIAEEIGVITAITDLVLDRSTRNLKHWQSMHPSMSALCMHVNLSSCDIAQDQLPPRVLQALRKSDLHPQHLVLEITENTLMENIEGGMDQLLKLRELGVELAIDDFGTGYSSLSSLSKLPINNLKIDASFVRDLKPGTKHAEIVRAVVSLGATLGKSVIAEGIETESQMDMLDQLGCEGGQGYKLAKPMPEEDILRLMHELVAQQLAKERVLEPALQTSTPASKRASRVLVGDATPRQFEQNTH
jgi:diguanylate cyclase (GGDEF)-like protein